MLRYRYRRQTRHETVPPWTDDRNRSPSNQSNESKDRTRFDHQSLEIVMMMILHSISDFFRIPFFYVLNYIIDSIVRALLRKRSVAQGHNGELEQDCGRQA
jgi:hypothetical protein